MKKVVFIALTALVFVLGASGGLALGADVVVTQTHTGDIVLVDEAGTKTQRAAALDRPSMLKFDSHGNIFVLEYRSDFELNPKVSKIDPAGLITTFVEELPRMVPDDSGGDVWLSFLDLTVSADDRVFVLVRIESSPRLTEVWELAQGMTPTVIASFHAITYRFTFGPGGYLYLAANGHDYYSTPSEYNNPNNHVIRVSLSGQVSSFYELKVPNRTLDPMNGANLLSVRFDSNGDMFLLTQVDAGGQPNYRQAWKVQDGNAFVFAELGNIGKVGALSMTIDGEDNLFFAGGGSQCSSGVCKDGFIQKIDPTGQVTTLALFPNNTLNAMFYIDDTDFDSYRTPGLIMDYLLGFVDQAVMDGDLYGEGRGFLADIRLAVFVRMLEAASDFIDAGQNGRACIRLTVAHNRSDGEGLPRDWVAGVATPDVADMIDDVMTLLECR